MNVQQLSLETLHAIPDTTLSEDFSDYLRQLIDDCMRRPAVKKSRKITVTCELVPRVDEAGHCSTIDFSAQVSGKSPARVSLTPAMQCRKSQRGPMLVFDKDGQAQMPFED